MAQGIGMAGDIDRIEACDRALQAIRPIIPDDLYRDAYDDIHRFNEYGLAMETLADQIAESDLRISREQYALIAAAFATMPGADVSRAEWLLHHCVVD